MKTIAFTGHRPDKLPNGYKSNHQDIFIFILNELCKESAPLKIITGGALGIDALAHRAALDLKKIKSLEGEVKVIIAEPFPYFWKKWFPQSIESYLNIREYADEIIQVDKDEKFTPWKMQKRNEFMVNHCDELWAFWNGSSGGTKNCIDYAKKVCKPVRNLYNEFK